MRKIILILLAIFFLTAGISYAATPFEEFVNTELPLRVSTPVPPSGNLTPSKYLRTTGIGLGVEVVDAVGGGEITVRESDGIPEITGVTELRFDQDTGLSVDDLGGGVTEISIGSHWKDLEVDGQTTLTPSGEETLEFEAGSNITITTDAASTPKKIIISGGETSKWADDTQTLSPLNDRNVKVKDDKKLYQSTDESTYSYYDSVNEQWRYYLKGQEYLRLEN